MKKALKLVLMYFLTLILATVTGVIFYSVYLHIQSYVAGSGFSFFNREGLLRALFYVVFCIILFICPVMIYARISNKGGIPHFITFIILSVLTWVLLLPLTLKLEKKVFYNATDSAKTLTGGYFRSDGEKIYYFTSDYNDNPYVSTTTVVIVTSENGTVEIQNIAPSRDFELFRNAAPYSDVIIKNTFALTNFSTPLISFSLIMQHAKDSIAKGWTFFLAFLSMGLLLCTLYGAADLFPSCVYIILPSVHK